MFPCCKLFRVLPILLTFIVPLASHAQDDQPSAATATMTVTTRIVALSALVRNAKGDLVRDLKKDDFVLKEDGKLQNIRYFNADNDIPLSIGLMIDTSGSQMKYFAEQRVASQTFLRSMLTRPEDRAFVIRFDTDVLLLQKLTSDQALLKRSLAMLASPHKPRADITNPATGGTLLYDAICATAQQVTSKERTRRAVILLTDGEDWKSKATLEQAVEQAQMADTVVYTAIYTDHDTSPGTAVNSQISSRMGIKTSGRGAMERIAKATGGRVFVVSKDQTIEEIYKKIEDDLRMEYRFGFTPGKFKPGTFHTLDLKPKQKDLTIQTREGYFTPQ